MTNYSKNKELNILLNEIEKQVRELGLDEVKHYYDAFPECEDYNIAQYGNLLIYYNDIHELYKNAGYKTKFSDSQVWEHYKKQVGYAVRQLIKNELTSKGE